MWCSSVRMFCGDEEPPGAKSSGDGNSHTRMHARYPKVSFAASKCMRTLLGPFRSTNTSTDADRNLRKWMRDGNEVNTNPPGVMHDAGHACEA